MVIFIVRGGRVVEGMGVSGVRDEEKGRGFVARVSKEEVIVIEEITGCGIKECEDIGSVWDSNDIR